MGSLANNALLTLALFALANSAAVEGADAEPPVPLEVVWQYSLRNEALVRGTDSPNAITDLGLADVTGEGNAEVLVTSADGVVTVISRDGEKVWRRTGLQCATRLTVGRLHPPATTPVFPTDPLPLPPAALESVQPVPRLHPLPPVPSLPGAAAGEPRVAVATCAPPHLFVYDAAGSRQMEGWLRLGASTKTAVGLVGPPTWLGAADFDGNGDDVLLVGAAGGANPGGGTPGPQLGACVAYGMDSKVLWVRRPVRNVVSAACVGALREGQGPLWFVGGSEGGCVALDGDGAERYHASFSGRVTGLVLADLEDSGDREVVIAGQNGAAQVHDGNGALRWGCRLGGAIEALAVLPGAPGRKDRVVAATSAENGVALLAAGGDVAWRRKLNDAPSSVVAFASLRPVDSLVVVGTEGGELRLLSEAGETLAVRQLPGAVAKLAVLRGDAARQSLLIAGLRTGAVVGLRRQSADPPEER